MKAGRVLRFDSLNAITNDDLPQPEPAVGQLLVRDCPPQINNRASALDLWGVRIGAGIQSWIARVQEVRRLRMLAFRSLRRLEVAAARMGLKARLKTSVILTRAFLTRLTS
jgi:hypothetical protein